MTSVALPVQGRSWWDRIKPWVLPVIPFLLVLGAWLAAIAAFNPPIGVLPRPWAVGEVPFSRTDEYFSNVQASLGRLVIGFLVAAVTGIVAGLAAGLSRPIAEFFGPIITSMNAISGIAWIPLGIAWFGPGGGMVTFIIWNAAFFLVFGNTMLGVRLVPSVLGDGLRTLGASRWQVIRQVIVPGAMPYLMAGIRSGLGFAWRGLIAAELVGGTDGLGRWMFVEKEFSRTDIIVAAALTIGLIGYAMDRLLLAPLERRTIERWGLVESS